MHFPNTLALASLAASAQAIAFPDGVTGTLNSLLSPQRRSVTQCPAVWHQISSDLSALFLSGGQCNDDARAAIRAAFHDCFPDGGCDGSLALPDELSRVENTPMTATVNKLAAMAKQRNVTTADMISFAASHAVVTCPQGPLVQTFVGRKDATTAAPPGQLVSPKAAGDAALAAFQARGFTAEDLGALIGAHTTARQFNTDPSKAGAPQDSTPGVWDLLYYAQTLMGVAPFSFQSDINLTKQPQVGPFMMRFAVDKLGWDSSFTRAMAKLEVLGIADKSVLIDCTSALPIPHLRRDLKAAAVNARSVHS